MTTAELRGIILSADFKPGLEEVSSYLTSIMQEAPIVHLLAKYFGSRSIYMPSNATNATT